MDREGQVEEGVSRSTNELQGPRGSSLERVYISEDLADVPGALRAQAPGVRFLDLSRNRLTTLPQLRYLQHRFQAMETLLMRCSRRW